MFVSRIKNRSGFTTIVVVSKNNGKFVEVKNFGTEHTKDELDELYSMLSIA